MHWHEQYRLSTRNCQCIGRYPLIDCLVQEALVRRLVVYDEGAHVSCQRGHLSSCLPGMTCEIAFSRGEPKKRHQ